jgi:diaminopimelate epimerase
MHTARSAIVPYLSTSSPFCFQPTEGLWQVGNRIMKISFTKMHGAGNDFIMIDDRSLEFPLGDKAFIQCMTSRRTGIGSDGILLLQPSETAQFRMRFINPDGGEQDMCGNGARCIARFAFDLGVAGKQMDIETGAGPVRAEMNGELVRLGLTDPTDLRLDLPVGLDWPVDFINTGVPHAVAWVEDVRTVDITAYGPVLRSHELFQPKGTNANFARVEADSTLSIRTYERGVEAETLACGTGAAAVAVLAAKRGRVKLPVTVHCVGGHDLVINRVRGITTLLGGAERVFDGEMEYGNRV